MVEQLTQSEKDEIFLDSCDAYVEGKITTAEFKKDLVRCGYNATDIEEMIKEYKPNTP